MAINESSLRELYTNYKPAYNNLYEITISGGEHEETINNYIKFHAVSVTFGGESLGLTRNEVTKRFQLNDTNAFKRSDTLSITWREDEDWSIKRYHEDWIGQFYNKDKDCYISCPTDKTSLLYRTIRVTLPRNGNFEEDTSEYHSIEFKEVLPQDIPGIALSWATQANIITHTLSYYVTEWGWVNPFDWSDL